ncbi:unnamed protein product, partial [Mesorhabditis belari]|uniref:TRAF3-interacting protein 1 C-terminal domain-containing protein n=1 Tax=Mesorhabditis belari TaxID=2138241 RepID=A0AAF3FPQ2_9BILA
MEVPLLVNTDGSLNDVKASKIVAGKEAEETIKLLQKFAQEARQYRDGSVTSNKENKKKSSTTSKERESSKTSSKSSSKSSSDKGKAPEKRSKSKDKVKDETKDSKAKDSKTSSKDRDSKSKDRDSEKKKDKEHSLTEKDREKSKDRSSSKKDREKTSSKSEKEKKERSSKTKTIDEAALPRRTSIMPTAASIEPSPSFQTEIDHHLDSHDDEASGTAKTEDSGFAESDRVISPRPPPSEARDHMRIGTSMGRPQTSMGRPGTAAARAAPPKLKKKQIAEIEQKQQVLEPKSEIFTETTSAPQQDEDFLIEEQEESRPEVTREEFDPNAEHGGLVAKIMETREQLEDGQVKMESDDVDDGEMARQRHQVENLQKNLQRVTQTAFPLAKLFDFAQEDLDSMMKELEKWRNETRKNELEWKEREAKGHGEVHKYSSQLAQLEDSIRETRQQLQNVKGKLNSNEEQMKVMLANM